MREWSVLLGACFVVLSACGDNDSSENNNNQNENQAGVCGDGALDTGEACDNGTANSDSQPDACRTNCRDPWCGDGVVDSGEACDDGNINSGDGCSADCQSNEQCGNGILDPGEECDDASDNADVSDAACRTDCTPQRCGDRIADSTEECDEGSANSDLIPGACRTDCRLAWCGDAIIDPGEACDDGNTTDGDGCHGGCDVESAWQCDGVPSVCTCATYRSGPDCDQCVVFVSLDATGPGEDGETWDTAFRTIQAGIDAAHAASYGTGCEVWVAEGTYHIFVSDPLNTVALRSDVSLYGGFAMGETQRDQRDVRANETIIDGFGGPPGAAVYHVVAAINVHDVTVDGFTVQGGRATGNSIHTLGGGIYIDGSDITVSNCVITTNEAVRGGGIYIFDASPMISHTVLEGNKAQLSGGGMHNQESSPDISHCDFVANQATEFQIGMESEPGNGGAMYNVGASPVITDSTFTGNEGAWIGGIYNSQSSPVLTRCEISASDGGGLYNEAGSSVTLVQTTIRGGADWGVFNRDSTLVATDSIFADNAQGGMYSTNTQLMVSGCVFVGNSAQEGAGMYNQDVTGTITSTVFAGNVLQGDLMEGAGGAGLANVRSSPSIIACHFVGNRVEVEDPLSGENDEMVNGGGMHNLDSSPVISDCVFAGNEVVVTVEVQNENTVVAGNGGGLFNRESSPVITNCVFAGNRVVGGGDDNSSGGEAEVVVANGGGLFSFQESHPVITNCTFVGNEAIHTTGTVDRQEHGGAMDAYATCDPVVVNSVVWGNVAANGPSITSGGSVTTTVSYSLVEGGHAGIEVYDLNPGFALFDTPETGQWTGVSYDPATLQTVLTNSAASWTSGALQGRFVQPSSGQSLWLPVADNTATAIYVWGRVDDRAAVDGWYNLYDLHLGSSSPAIDMANDAAPNRLATDIDGVIWADVSGDGSPNVVTDMGAYEFVP